MNRQKFIMALTLGLVPIVVSAKRALKILDPGPVGGGCDGRELMYEGMPGKLSNTSYLPGWAAGGKKLIVEGTVYRKDGRTVAPNIIVYIYHTDSKGYYSPFANQVQGKRHGYLRGWVKTGCDGKYRFYTTMPAPYPQRSNPAHIHPVIKEPGINEYYIDEYQFDNDPLLTRELRDKAEDRGGTGIIKLRKTTSGILVCKRDIILGYNIPNYR
ncbi:intradiol ring-cleavage dioxygenase [Mucilaginibacter terrigena]|uniref:Intradiol ring-cleavage dioxygenase n=1 Tax=Mucilaginibacter terrigena TaxID=2492395 RepID=A0A4V1ZBK5_9SPHI|nr:intradiol ring-cleavage dioxygenase [Mucilaginibacter terrigena]RYU89247.1 intradiol ring-cleavage dioxygenase [Mucilaginibacter terrigena]